MKILKLIIRTLVFFAILNSPSYSAKKNFFNQGKILFEKKEFDKSKILFERDIVFNPRSEKSYLYLAKIFKNNNEKEEQEINLNSVLLLNPKNDEAIYMLILLKIEQSNYEESRDLIDKFKIVCQTFCSKEKEIEDKFSKIIPSNDKKN